MIIKTGTYVGNGTSQAVPTGNNLSSVGGMVIVQVISTVAGDQAVTIVKTSTMAADAVKLLDGSTALVTGEITAFTTTGFTVGSGVRANKSGVTYHFLAIEMESGDTEFEVGTYNGNGTDNRNITPTNVTGAIGVCMVFGDYTAEPVWMSNVHSADRSQPFSSTTATVTNRIQSVGTGTFQVGTNDSVNRGTGTPAYHWAVFREIASKLEVITYTGNGSDDRTLTGAGFQPTWGMAHMRHTFSNAHMAIRGPGHSGDNSSPINAGAQDANKIQMFTADGFQVGTDAQVNTNLLPYTALFFNAAPFTPPAGGNPNALASQGAG